MVERRIRRKKVKDLHPYIVESDFGNNFVGSKNEKVDQNFAKNIILSSPP